MKTFTFKRGIHPDDAKSSTSGIPIETISPKAGCEMIFPLQQNAGAPNEPLVEIGDTVRLGQKIGETGAFVSAPVHSSVSGVVKEFREVLLPTGARSKAIVIENDGANESDEKSGHTEEYKNYSKEQILAKIKDAGVVGLGGAGFPTHVKLSPPPDKKIDTIIINASECEPYLTSDHRVLLEETERFIRGIKVVLQIFPDAKGIIGIEANKMDAVEKLNQILADEPKIEVKVLKPKYPQGSEKQLIYACLGREVPSGGLPADVGAIVINVDTTVAIERGVVRNKPLIRKIITVDGGAVNKPGNYKVRLGMSYRDFIEAIGGFKEEPTKMLSGGPMMGVSMFDIDVPLVKVSSALLCFTEKEVQLSEERNCIRCAKCVDHCPMGLMPLLLNQNIIHGETDEFLKNNGMDCVECGSCSFVCPSKRHLAQSIRATRRNQMELRRRKA